MPEKMLNCFVRSIALVERAGNALGTLAFTWATVVLLGGYPTVLRPTDDFWFATTIVFLEAARMFSRNNRLDYQVFFYTRGAVRPLGWKGLVIIIPAAILRVVLALMRLIQHDYYGRGDNIEDNTNLAPSLNIFYAMVLGQGALYLVACTLDIFTFIPRRSLARHGGLKGQLGMESISLYHGYVLEKCMERDALAPKKISLSSFAMDSLNSDSPKKQLHGIQFMQKLLQDEPTKSQLLGKLTTSANTSARLINMLGWTNPRNATVRLFAAKVTAELAKNFRADTITGTI
nr:unnamed protein product [Digitaria exilis]